MPSAQRKLRVRSKGEGMDDIRNPILDSIAAADGANSALPKGLISADSHITEPPHCYVDRIDPKYRDRAPHVLTEGDGGDAFVIDGLPGTVPMGIVAAAGIDPRDIKRGETRFSDLHKGGWEPNARILDQEKDGLAAEVEPGRERRDGDDGDQEPSGSVLHPGRAEGEVRLVDARKVFAAEEPAGPAGEGLGHRAAPA